MVTLLFFAFFGLFLGFLIGLSISNNKQSKRKKSVFSKRNPYWPCILTADGTRGMSESDTLKIYEPALPYPDVHIALSDTKNIKFPTTEQQEKYGDKLAPYIANKVQQDPTLIGTSTDPIRFGEEEILKLEAEGRSKFAMQQMLDTTLSDIERYPLKCADLIVMDLDNGRIYNRTKSIDYNFSPYPKEIQNLVKAGGLVEYTRSKLGLKK